MSLQQIIFGIISVLCFIILMLIIGICVTVRRKIHCAEEALHDIIVPLNVDEFIEDRDITQFSAREFHGCRGCIKINLDDGGTDGAVIYNEGEYNMYMCKEGVREVFGYVPNRIYYK